MDLQKEMKTLKEISDMHPEYNWVCQDQDGTIKLFKSDFTPVVWGSTFLSRMWSSYWGYSSNHKGSEITSRFPVIELNGIGTEFPDDCKINGLKIVSIGGPQ
jgi:hypothetical protein